MILHFGLTIGRIFHLCFAITCSSCSIKRIWWTLKRGFRENKSFAVITPFGWINIVLFFLPPLSFFFFFLLLLWLYKTWGKFKLINILKQLLFFILQTTGPTAFPDSCIPSHNSSDLIFKWNIPTQDLLLFIYTLALKEKVSPEIWWDPNWVLDFATDFLLVYGNLLSLYTWDKSFDDINITQL